MITREKNPEYLNSFLDYSITILNKSPNSVKEYNYDLTNFLKFMMIRFKLTNKDIYDEIDITLFNENYLKKISLDDIHAYVSHLAINNRSKATTRARKISTIRILKLKSVRLKKLLEDI
jgi:site-specific recombinase XerD